MKCCVSGFHSPPGRSAHLWAILPLFFLVSPYCGEIQAQQWLTFTTADGLADNKVYSVSGSRNGTVWFGTRGGVSRYDGTWQTFTAADGLADDSVESVFESPDGELWFGTRSGVSRYDGETWQTFTPNDGLGDNRITSILQAADGTMWFGTDSGATSFRRPLHALAQTVILRAPPPTLGDGRFFFESRGVEIGSDRQPDLSFALTQATNEPGYSDWSPFTYVNGFEAAGLHNGAWTFHVRAKDRHGNVDPTPATITFTVDLTVPTVVISSPRRGEAVTGKVAIQGSVFDGSSTPDLKRFILYYGEAGPDGEVAGWDEISAQEIDDPLAFRIEDAVLGTWDTDALSEPSGSYVLRI